MIQKQNAPGVIAGNAGELPKAWCVAEYVVRDPSSEIPVSMLITASRLHTVFSFAEPNRNSEWRRCITPDHYVGVIVHATGTMQECRIEATRMIMSRPVRPRCNMYGFNSFSQAVPIECSNGETYATQAEAALTLGLNAGQLSRHLKGEVAHVKQLVFRYKD